MDLAAYVRSVPDFPKPGILFRDITPLLADEKALKESVRQLADLVRDQKIDRVVGIESRGFIFGVPLAIELGVGFVPLRKPGKLPRQVRSRSYALEYGEATLEAHVEDIAAGERVVLVDDLLATGGTARAAVELIGEAGAKVVAFMAVIELLGLDGRALLGDVPTHVLLPMPVGGDE